MNMKKFLVGLVLFITGCAGTSETVKTADTYFKEGEDFYASRRYEDAIAEWKKVKESFSSPELTTMAELKIADAYFENRSYIEAAAAYDDFRKLHPNHDQAAYAYYRLALCYYNQITGIDTDQTPVKNAVKFLDSFIKLYPKTEYVPEAKAKLDECIGKQVEYEVYVGHFYLRSGKYQAAIKRLEETLAKYPKVENSDQVLFYIGKAYFLSGDKTKGKEAFNRLAKQYVSSRYLEEARQVMEKYY
ncbi:outer membrane protein assembly factor BamD [Geotalea toluenoxydans]|uniref:outer membrane protein assembly factor BamD n=1 Tax=Geotalea toluenoxydans TaxID=421624 RepID=UPI0006D223CE|nr:outer membrane protein assembly factor BamD [Geotalea toluenoxydans]